MLELITRLQRPKLEIQDPDTSDVPLALHQKSKFKKKRVSLILASPRDEVRFPLLSEVRYSWSIT